MVGSDAAWGRWSSGNPAGNTWSSGLFLHSGVRGLEWEHTGQGSLWAVAIAGLQADARECGRGLWDLGGSGRPVIPRSRLHLELEEPCGGWWRPRHPSLEPACPSVRGRAAGDS